MSYTQSILTLEHCFFVFLSTRRKTADGKYTLKKSVETEGQQVPTVSAHPGTSNIVSNTICVEVCLYLEMQAFEFNEV